MRAERDRPLEFQRFACLQAAVEDPKAISQNGSPIGPAAAPPFRRHDANRRSRDRDSRFVVLPNRYLWVALPRVVEGLDRVSCLLLGLQRPVLPNGAGGGMDRRLALNRNIRLLPFACQDAGSHVERL